MYAIRLNDALGNPISPGATPIYMKPGFILGLVSLLTSLAPSLSAQTSGLDAPQAVGAYFNGTFPSTAPGQATGWTTENAFPNLTFVDPLWLTDIPGTNKLLLVGKNGQIWSFTNSSATTQAQVTSVLDWASKTQTSEDQGFYSLVFHPQFGQAGSANANYVYVCYNHKPALTGAGPNNTYWRVSRFTWIPATGKIDPASEFVFINQYDADLWHNGGAMYFDNDGFLNITCGDGGDSAASGGLAGALANTQRINSGFFSGLFRIDIDNNPAKSHAIRRQPLNHINKPAAWPASSTQGYGIPNDNPWQDPAGTILEEFAAIGLRSPHTAHYDSLTGDVWIGDVGEGSREELTRLPKGANAQWGFREGSVAGPGTKPASVLGLEESPVYDYSHSIGSCIIGGMRYRGTKWNSLLGGKILFGDHVRGRIWSATLAEGVAPAIQELVSGFPTGNKAGLGNFCTDAAGEVYLMTLAGTDKPGGTIRRLVAAGVAVEPPALLSQTGVFTNLTTLATASGVLPYDVANPLWSDAAHKLRWIILPNNGVHDTAAERIAFSEKGNWVFPAGTVFVKHFEVPLDERNPASPVKRLETRFLVCTAAGGKYGVTYRWNAAGTDATLLTSGEGADFDVTLQDGSTQPRHWDFPSRGDCMLCHNTTAGQALGVRTHQLNRDYFYPSTGRTANQLATFNALGMFDRSLTSEELRNYLEARPLEDETAPLEHRVRSYLDSNCSHCHQPGGTIDYFDARLATPLNLQGLINGVLQGHFSIGPDGRYMKPGDPDLSATYVRLSHSGDGVAMPPLAKNLVDANVVAHLHDYLTGLVPSQFETTPTVLARYVRLTALSEMNGNPWTTVAELSVLDSNGAKIPGSQVSVFDFDSEETVDETAPATRAIDGNTSTFWHTGYGTGGLDQLPHHLTLNLGSIRGVGGFEYTPRQGTGTINGRIKNYEVHTSTDGVNWTLMNSGVWTNTADTFRYDAGSAVRPARCQIAGPTGQVNGAFDVTIAFDMDVTDFTASDLQVSGAAISSFRGKGYYYVARISPSSSLVTISVPQNAASPKGVGSFASGQLNVNFHDNLPPQPHFTGVPASVGGAFQVGLSFDEAVTGLTLSDFTVVNGTLNGVSPSGINYVLSITPSGQGAVGIELHHGAVVDGAANPMGDGISLSIPYLPYVMAREAETGVLTGGFVVVNDAAASAGAYIWVPQDSRNGVTALNTAMKANYDFVAPRAGQYRVRGLVRSDDASSDSLYIGFDGQATPLDWHTNQAAGQVGSLLFQWDLANSTRDPVNTPSLFNLTAGAHTLQIYGRDDGTRLDRLELQPVKPLPTWSGQAVAVNGPLSLTLSFSESVTGLTAGDISISGGQVTSVTGSGTTYTVTATAQASSVILSLPADMVVSTSGNGNYASDTLVVVYRTAYEHWAVQHGVEGSPAAQLSDEDGDGLQKVLEFAFNLDPSKPDLKTLDPAHAEAGGLPKLMPIEQGHMALQFLRRKNVPGLSYVPQFGSTLGDLLPTNAVPVVESLDDNWERVTVPDSGAPANSPKRFGRVKVIMLP